MEEKQLENGSLMIRSLINAYAMKLDSLQKEIQDYKSEESVWKVSDGITNSGGNLCLHLIGNLNHFIGANLGNTGYVRERDLEFSDTGVSREKLLAEIESVKKTVTATFEGLSEEDLAGEYPENLFDKNLSSGEVLAYMSGHFSYHLGQINYHRRLLDR